MDDGGLVVAHAVPLGDALPDMVVPGPSLGLDRLSGFERQLIAGGNQAQRVPPCREYNFRYWLFPEVNAIAGEVRFEAHSGPISGKPLTTAHDPLRTFDVARFYVPK